MDMFKQEHLLKVKPYFFSLYQSFFIWIISFQKKYKIQAPYNEY